MVKNRKLSKTISDLGWRKFRILTEAKCEKYGKEFRVIDRWEPTSQKCSCCGFKGGKKELNVREWTCLSCGAHHDRDINAAVNILEVVQPKTKVKAVKETVAENPIQLSLFVSVSEAPLQEAAPPQEAEVAEGQRSIIYRTWSRRNSTRKKVVDGNDVSTRPEFFKQLSLFD